MRPETFDKRWYAAIKEGSAVKMENLLRAMGFAAAIECYRLVSASENMGQATSIIVVTNAYEGDLPVVVIATAAILICCGLIPRTRRSTIVEVPAFGVFKNRFTKCAALPLDKLPRPKAITKRARVRK